MREETTVTRASSGKSITGVRGGGLRGEGWGVSSILHGSMMCVIREKEKEKSSLPSVYNIFQFQISVFPSLVIRVPLIEKGT